MNPMNCYRFSPNATANPPEGNHIDLLDKAFTDQPLTREEKDGIADWLYGTFGAHGPTYKLSGWAWPMAQARQLRRVLVSFKDSPDTFHAYFVPDKTSLRRALNRSDIVEMLYIGPQGSDDSPAGSPTKG